MRMSQHQEELFSGLLSNLIDEGHDASLDGTPHEDIDAYVAGQIRGIEAKNPGFIDYLRRAEPYLAALVQTATT